MNYKSNIFLNFLLAFAIVLGIGKLSLSQTSIIGITPQTSVPTDTGKIVFKYLKFEKKKDGYGDSLVVKGLVSNHSNKNWFNPGFKIKFYDKNDDFLGELDFIIDELNKKDNSQLLRQLYAPTARHRKLKTKDLRKAKGYTIEMFQGTYDAKYDVSIRQPLHQNSLSYEDDSIEINWAFSEKYLSFALKNKSGNPIEIDWNKVSYINTSGDAQKVIHNGVKYLEKDNFLTSSLVPPTARIKDIIIPADNINYIYNYWRETPMFPEGDSAMMYKGKSFSVFMPMEVNGEIENYTFTFDINDVSY